MVTTAADRLADAHRRIREDMERPLGVWNPTDRTDWLAISTVRARTAPFGPDDDKADKALWVSALHVPTRFDAEFAERVQQTHRRMQGVERRFLVVDGPGHFGKSTLAMNFAITTSGIRDGQPPPRRNGREYRPAAFVDVANTDGHKGMLVSVCRSLGLSDGGQLRDLRQRLINNVRHLETRWLVVDDHHMVKRKSATNTDVIDGLRDLLKLPVTWVFIVADDRYAALSRTSVFNRPTHGFDASFASLELRRERDLKLSPLTLNDNRDEIRKMIGWYFARVHKMLPYLEMPVHRRGGLVDYLATECGGKPGRILWTLKEATCSAIHHGVPLDAEILQATVTGA